jgi:DNA-binding CsgD family transcriptional regulator
VLGLVGRCAVDEEHELLVAGVPQLEDRARLHDEDAPALELVALGRLAEIDGQRAVEHDEDLLLHRVAVPPASPAGRVAPQVRARPGHGVGETRDRPRVVVPARHPVELVLPEDREAHDAEYRGLFGVAERAYDRPMAGPIIGRDTELASLRAFLERSLESAAALVLEGEAGMGKTTLWTEGVAIAQARATLVLEACPAESEATFSFAGLGDLLGSMLDEALASLPDVQRRALARALVLEDDDGRPPDAHAVGVAVLGALRAFAAERPLLVAVDDVQWLDGASAGALGYAVRRLRGERVGVLLARRGSTESALVSELARSFSDERLATVEVVPLDSASLHRLVHHHLGAALPRPLLGEVYEASGGNPFYALEIVRMLQRTGISVEAGQPLPVPDSLHDLVHARLLELPPECREFLTAAAAHAHPTVELTESASGVDREAGLRPALDAHVVDLDRDRIRFTHPLLAAGAYETADPGRRREIHARLADVLRDPEARAWQLCASVDRPDEDVAAVLEDAARHARARGAPRPAALLLDRARELTPGDAAEEALRRAVDAAFLHFEAGDSRRAELQLREAIAPLEPGPARAKALVLLARIRLYESPTEARALFARVLEEAGDDPATLAVAHEGVAACCVWTFDGLGDALVHTDVGLSSAEELGDDALAADVLVVRLTAEAMLGRAEAAATAERALALQGSATSRRVLDQPLASLAEYWKWNDEHERARAVLVDLLQRAHDAGDENARPWLLYLLGDVERLRGNVETALALAVEGQETAEQSGQPLFKALTLALESQARAELGRTDEAIRAGRRARELAVGTLVDLVVASAFGHVELARGAPEAAVSELASSVAFVRAEGIVEPAGTRFVVDHVEGLIELARLDDAGELLGWYEGHATRLSRISALASCARCRGLLAAQSGDLDAAHERYREALARHDEVEIPLDRGRTLLAFGAAQRRSKRRREARATLEEALALFERIGAALWADRARDELRRISGRASTPGALTPAEQRVAALVAEGKTNREVAAALYLSDRTVEGHLSRIFGKLGIRQRGEVGPALAARQTQGEAHSNPGETPVSAESAAP